MRINLHHIPCTSELAEQLEDRELYTLDPAPFGWPESTIGRVLSLTPDYVLSARRDAGGLGRAAWRKRVQVQLDRAGEALAPGLLEASGLVLRNELGIPTYRYRAGDTHPGAVRWPLPDGAHLFTTREPTESHLDLVAEALAAAGWEVEIDGVPWPRPAPRPTPPPRPRPARLALDGPVYSPAELARVAALLLVGLVLALVPVRSVSAQETPAAAGELGEDLEDGEDGEDLEGPADPGRVWFVSDTVDLVELAERRAAEMALQLAPGPAELAALQYEVELLEEALELGPRDAAARVAGLRPRVEALRAQLEQLRLQSGGAA